MGIKSKRVDFTFDESSLHTALEPQGYAPRESPHITDVLLMDGRTVRIPPVQRFEEQPMSDKVISDELLRSVQGFLRTMFLHPEVGGELHQAAGSLFDQLAALAPAPAAASSGAEAGVLDLLPRWEAWRVKWWTEADTGRNQYALGITAVLGDCLDDLRRVLDIPEDEPAPVAVGFQERAVGWVREAFGSEPADCKEERAHRFLEEALELGQAAGTTESEARQLVEYVYGRSTGVVAQEVGGVMLTLAPFAAAHGVDMYAAGEAELARVNTPAIIAKCRAKNASKPRNSPLPGSAPAPAGAE